MRRHLLGIGFITVTGFALLGQSPDWTKQAPPLPPMDMRRAVPAQNSAESLERRYERDFDRKIDTLSEEWNKWLELRAKRDKSVVDLKAICEEGKQLDKALKLAEELRAHRASPCTLCPKIE